MTPFSNTKKSLWGTNTHFIRWTTALTKWLYEDGQRKLKAEPKKLRRLPPKLSGMNLLVPADSWAREGEAGGEQWRRSHKNCQTWYSDGGRRLIPLSRKCSQQRPENKILLISLFFLTSLSKFSNLSFPSTTLRTVLISRDPHHPFLALKICTRYTTHYRIT